MVVIRAEEKFITETFGNDFIGRIWDFSGIIGYTPERDGNEIKVEFNPDRPDLFSFTTLESAISCYYDGKKTGPIKYRNGKIVFSVSDEAVQMRPFVTSFEAVGTAIRNRFRDLIDFQERVHQSIGKNRTKVSIGIHDMRKVVAPLRYVSMDSEKLRFTPYDGSAEMSAMEILSQHPKGIEYSKLLPDTRHVPVIMDSRDRVLSMPPVINGDVSRVSEDTGHFFVDITGTDTRSVAQASLLLQYFFQNSGFSIVITKQYGGMDFRSIAGMDGRSIEINVPKAAKILGVESIREEEISDALLKMGYIKCDPSGHNSGLDVTVPGNRIDVMGEMDIIEDIAKAVGYDSIVPVVPVLDVIGSSRPDTVLRDRIREISIGLGYQEVMTFVVTSSAFYEGVHREDGIAVQNPKSLDFSVVRDRLRLNILEFFRINKRRSLPQKVFEIGDVIVNGVQKTSLCFAMISSRSGFSDIKQPLEALLQRFGQTIETILPVNTEEFIKGRSGTIVINGKKAGVIGEIDPASLLKFDLANPVSVFEIDTTAFTG
ncbi:MAG: phenylalanine--tRNA ligase subunit beta [Thermoplasmataceae archaeon]|jgi:phenylalanyl-tRNA synthetase beta chain